MPDTSAPASLITPCNPTSSACCQMPSRKTDIAAAHALREWSLRPASSAEVVADIASSFAAGCVRLHGSLCLVKNGERRGGGGGGATGYAPWIWERLTDDIRMFMGDIRAGCGRGRQRFGCYWRSLHWAWRVISDINKCGWPGCWRYAGCGAGRRRIARRSHRAVGVGCCPFPVAS